MARGSGSLAAEHINDDLHTTGDRGGHAALGARGTGGHAALGRNKAMQLHWDMCTCLGRGEATASTRGVHSTATCRRRGVTALKITDPKMPLSLQFVLVSRLLCNKCDTGDKG